VLLRWALGWTKSAPSGEQGGLFLPVRWALGLQGRESHRPNGTAAVFRLRLPAGTMNVVPKIIFVE